MAANINPVHFIVITEGDRGAGKTALIKNFVWDEKSDSNNSGGPLYRDAPDNHHLKCSMKRDELDVVLHIWDIDYGRWSDPCKRTIPHKAKDPAILLCVDLTEQYAVDRIAEHKKALKWQNPGAKIILVGTKADKEQERVIRDEEFKALGKTLNFDHCAITSANTGLGVEELFADTARLYVPQNVMTEAKKQEPSPQKVAAVKGSFFDEGKTTRGESMPPQNVVIRRKSFP